MAAHAERPLTPGEWAALSPGLVRALRAAGCRPLLRDEIHPAAMIAALWRGGRPPILTRFDRIWWPDAPDDLSAPALGTAMSILQHELQHVLDYAEGWLTTFGYLARPSNWTYAWRIVPGQPWDDYGAEQRASMAESLWLAEHGWTAKAGATDLRAIIPWAR